MQGLKPSQTASLERLYQRRFPRETIYRLEQARELAALSRHINRQIGLLVDRKGKVQMVIAGDANSIYIPELPRKAPGKLRGLRLLHTHLGESGLSQEDLLDMIFLRLDAAVALTVDMEGEPSRWQGAWLEDGAPDSRHLTPLTPWHDAQCDLAARAEEYENHAFISSHEAEAANRAILVSVSMEPAPIQEANLDELADLAATAGLKVGGRLIQRVPQPNPRLILGKGKLADLEILALNANAETLVFDGELSPAQLRNLADITERKVLDRTQLILDIFAQAASTRAGKLQVELAQLAYAQPRLAGKHKALDRLMGGIGGRGPGESRLETDRRKSRERMAFLKRELEKLRGQRARARHFRERNHVPAIALVGYTNAGKSTLLNTLTSSQVLAANKLFATLDPVTRRLRFPRHGEIIFSDTVGFIRNLPSELMEAFRATLEELESAALLLHVADASRADLNRQMESVDKILEDLGLGNKKRLLALNKLDALEPGALEDIKRAYPYAIPVSGLNGAGLDLLLKRIEREIFMNSCNLS